MVDKQTIEELEIIIKANVTQAMQGIQDVVKAVEKDANKIKAPIQQISTDVDRSIAKSTKGIERALDTISGKSSKLGNLKAQIQENIKAIEMFQEALKDLKAGALSENTQGSLYALAERNIANRTGRNPEEVSYKEVDKEIKDILSNEEKRAETINQINSLLKDQTGELNKQEKEFKQVRNTENWHKGLEKIWHSFKRGLLTIMGVRSAWALLRKGMSEALQTSEKLQAQVRVTSNAFGQLFLPIMEKVVAITRKAVIFIGLVIEALTGMNLLAKTTTKSIQDQNRALEGTLSTIDEIENLQNPNQTYLNDIEALGQFQEEIAKMRKWMKDSGIYEWLQNVGNTMRDKIIPNLKKLWEDYLKPMLKWCYEHPEIFEILFAVFLSGKLLGAINSVLGLGGMMGGGLLAIYALVKALATIGTVVIGVKLDAKEMGENARQFFTGKNRDYYLNFFGKEDGSLTELLEKINTLTVNAEAYKKDKATAGLGVIGSIGKKMGGGLLFGLMEQIGEATGGAEALNEALKNITQAYEETVTSAYKLKESGTLTNDEIKELDRQLAQVEKDMRKIGVPEEEIAKILKDAQKSAKEMSDEVGSENKQGSLINSIKKVANTLKEGFKVKIKGETTDLKSQLQKTIQEAFTGMGNLGSSIYNWVKKNAKLEADGYVAYAPTLAIQGEYAGARTNPEITAPQDMIEASMLNAFSKIIPYMNQGTQHGDIVLNINGKEFARATYEDTQNEIARRNSSTTIKVVR